MKYFFAWIVVSMIHLNALAQKSHFGSWSIINAQLSLSGKWAFFGELQLRSQSFFNNYFYYEAKGGFEYSLNKKIKFALGTGNFGTYSDGGNFEQPKTNNEFRIWEQAVMSNKLNALKIEQRLRIEQRIYSNGEYRNRFRYRLGFTVPLNKENNKYGKLYITTFEELFFTNKVPHFSRSRFLIGPGYSFNNYFTIQPAYVYQFDISKSSKLGKHFLQVSLLLKLNPGKPVFSSKQNPKN